MTPQTEKLYERLKELRTRLEQHDAVDQKRKTEREYLVRKILDTETAARISRELDEEREG